MKQALDKGIEPKGQLIINPGSEQIRYTAERDGILDIFKQMGALIMTNACGPCIGPVSYTHLDVYKRQAMSCYDLRLF